MSDAVRFLTGLTQALAASVLYGEDHPAYRRAADAALRQLHDLHPLLALLPSRAPPARSLA